MRTYQSPFLDMVALDLMSNVKVGGMIQSESKPRTNATKRVQGDFIKVSETPGVPCCMHCTEFVDVTAVIVILCPQRTKAGMCLSSTVVLFQKQRN